MRSTCRPAACPPRLARSPAGCTPTTTGSSGARGPVVTAAAAGDAVGAGRDGEFTQTAWGGDVEYSRDYYLVRAETVWSLWKVPEVSAPVIDAPLRAVATYVEGRYKVLPG